MVYLQAFILGGILCFLGQLLFVNTKLGFVKIFMICITLGVILSAVGVMGPMGKFGGAGLIISIVDAGEGLYWSMVALLSGNPLILIRYAIMIAIVLVTGLICGFLTHVRQKDQ